MLSSLHLSSTSDSCLRENSLWYFKQENLSNLYVLVLFDFEFHLWKMVENWHAARIRSSLENSPFIHKAVNIRQCLCFSFIFPDFLLWTGDLYNHYLKSLLVYKKIAINNIKSRKFIQKKQTLYNYMFPEKRRCTVSHIMFLSSLPLFYETN